MIYLETGYARSEGEINFLRLVHDLPEEQREVVYLKYAQELSFREIAGILGIPARTVQSRLRIALKKLRKRRESRMYNRQERNEEVYLYKALKLSGSLQMSEEEKSEQIRKIMEISKADRLTGKKRERADFAAFLIRQIPFIGWKIWSIQALVMISAVVFFYGTDRGPADVTWLFVGRRLPFLVGALGTVMAMIGIPYIMQSFCYRMYEMEK